MPSKYPILDNVPADSLVRLIDKEGLEGRLPKSVTEALMDGLYGVFMNPDADISIFCFSRLFLDHGSAMELSDSSATDFKDNVLKTFGFDLDTAEQMPDFMLSVAEQFPTLGNLMEDSDFGEYDKSVVDAEDLEPNKVVKFMKKPMPRSFMSRFSACKKLEDVENIFNKQFFSELSVMGLRRRINLHKYMILRLMMDHSTSVRILQQDKLDDVFEAWGIDTTSKDTLQKSVRKLLSYHPGFVNLLRTWANSIQNS